MLRSDTFYKIDIAMRCRFVRWKIKILKKAWLSILPWWLAFSLSDKRHSPYVTFQWTKVFYQRTSVREYILFQHCKSLIWNTGFSLPSLRSLASIAKGRFPKLRAADSSKFKYKTCLQIRENGLRDLNLVILRVGKNTRNRTLEAISSFHQLCRPTQISVRYIPPVSL